MPEGSSFDEIMRNIVKERGGFLLEVEFPGMGKEIVGIKIGNIFHVAGDPSKVARADYSGFDDPEAMRRMATDAARTSQGGFHFFVGESGIMVGVDQKGKMSLLNGKETKGSKNINEFSFKLVSADFDPSRVDELRTESGMKVMMSDDARKKISGAHAEMREGDLDTSSQVLLVFNKDSGRLLTASEFAEQFMVEGFKAPQFSTPDYTSIGLETLTDGGKVQAPMDGSSYYVPYLLIRTFDGRMSDNLQVQTYPLQDVLAAPGQQISPKERQEDSGIFFMPSIQADHAPQNQGIRTNKTLQTDETSRTSKTQNAEPETNEPSPVMSMRPASIPHHSRSSSFPIRKTPCIQPGFGFQMPAVASIRKSVPKKINAKPVRIPEKNPLVAKPEKSRRVAAGREKEGLVFQPMLKPKPKALEIAKQKEVRRSGVARAKARPRAQPETAKRKAKKAPRAQKDELLQKKGKAKKKIDAQVEMGKKPKLKAALLGKTGKHGKREAGIEKQIGAKAREKNRIKEKPAVQTQKQVKEEKGELKKPAAARKKPAKDIADARSRSETSGKSRKSGKPETLQARNSKQKPEQLSLNAMLGIYAFSRKQKRQPTRGRAWARN